MSPPLSGCRASQFSEVQEVWEQSGAALVLSIPIISTRGFAPPAAAVGEAASSTGMRYFPCQPPLNGAIGIVTVGAATETQWQILVERRCVSDSVHLMPWIICMTQGIGC